MRLDGGKAILLFLDHTRTIIVRFFVILSSVQRFHSLF